MCGRWVTANITFWLLQSSVFAWTEGDYAPPPLAQPAPSTKAPDPLYEKSWHLKAIEAPAAWRVTEGRRDVVIAVVDSGVNYNHPELAHALARREADCDFDGKDDDGNGFADDCIGWNFSEEQSLPWDDNGHGTFIASIIAARKDNGLGGTGVCPGCSLMPLRFLDSDGLGDTEDAIRSIRYAARAKVAVISLSFAGEGYDQSLRDALKEAQDNDVVVVAAAGNDGINNDKDEIYPANYRMPNLITVAASRKDGDLWAHSSYGARKVHVAAPGVNIWGLWVDNKWYRSQGTSFATPIVAAVAGLVRSANRALTAEQVVSIIKSTVNPSTRLEGKVSTAGIINARRAVECAVDPNLSCLNAK